MVGVPRGKTCQTCRQRKIKCDGREPTCRQCARSARLCAGRELIFVNHSYHGYHTDRNSPSSGCVATGSCQSLNGLLQMQTQILFQSMLQQCLPQPSQAMEEMPLSWTRSVIYMNHSELLVAAVAAFTFGWHGHVDGRRDMSIRSRNTYGQALACLRTSLAGFGGDSSKDLSILATTELLTLYELYEFGIGDLQGWSVHLRGAESVLRMRWREVESSKTYREIFYSHRLLSLVNGLVSRERAVISNAMWLIEPSTRHQSSKFQELIDIGVDVTGFLEAADGLTAQSTDQAFFAYALETFTWYNRLAFLLSAWRSRWAFALPPNSRIPGIYPVPQLREGQPHAHYPSKSPQSLGVAFNYLQSARLIHLYNTIVLTLHLTALRLQKHADLSNHGTLWEAPFHNARASIVHEAMNYADDIALGADICVHNAWQSFGPVVGVFSLRTALKWYDFEDEQEIPRQGVLRAQSFRRYYRETCLRLLAVLETGDAKDI